MFSSEPETSVGPGSQREMGPAIRVKSVSKRYRIYRKPSHKLVEALWNTLFSRKKKLSRDFWALTDVDLEVPRGTTLGIIGRNGSGKSTLLQIITGVLQATNGHVEVNGRVSALLELGAGFNREFTGRENVFLQGAVMAIPRQEMERRLPAIEAFADIGEFIDQPVKTYSSGMYVRLAFAVAINVDADILIVDEALAVGDDLFRRRCYNRIEEMQREGKTILFVTHALGTVGALCDRATLLDGGRVLMTGAPGDAIKQYYRLQADMERKRGQLGHEVGSATKPRADEIEHGVTEVRTGNGGATVSKVDLLGSDGHPAGSIEAGDECTIKMLITFARTVSRPIAWISIKSLTGMSLITANNRSLGIDFEKAEPGDQVLAEFRQFLPLNKGSYALTVRVGELAASGEEIFLDSRWDVLTFRVTQSAESYGLISNKIAVTLTKIQSRPS